jgi:hypothetical protein
MITPKTIKELVSQHRRNNPVTISVSGKTAQLWSQFFIFEVPRDEIVDDLLEKHKGASFSMRTLLDRAGKELNGSWPEEYNADWRKDLLGKVADDTTFTRETLSVLVQGEPVQENVVKLVGQTSKEVRYVNTEIYNFCSDQLLRPVFKIHTGVRADGTTPGDVSVWEGKNLVGIIAALCPIE